MYTCGVCFLCNLLLRDADINTRIGPVGICPPVHRLSPPAPVSPRVKEKETT